MINNFQIVTHLGGNMELLSHYIEQQNKQNPEIINWKNHLVTDGLSYSYRDTVYDLETYPSNLHYHDYYELVIFEDGAIRYICEDCVYHPKHGNIILIPPRTFHMSVIDCDSTRYKRHVFYLYPSAFDSIGHSALTSFLTESKKGSLLTLQSDEAKHELINQLQLLKKSLQKEPSPLDMALGLSLVIRIFCLLNQRKNQSKTEVSSLPENILMIQNYIDNNFSHISSVSEVAEQFFYSREYVSRLFKKYFDTTVSDYIMKRRISKSQSLIVQGVPLIDVAYQVGFGSLSTFIRAFRSVVNMTPSEYRKLKKNCP